MKYVFIVPDGMFDLPIASLDNKTPLEVANTVNMDYLTKAGIVGQIKTIPDGMKPGSDVGNMNLLGYDPKIYLSGRAALEAANLNIELRNNQIAVRANFVTISGNKMQDYSAGHISTKEASVLIDDLNKELESDDMKFYCGKSYRHILVMNVRNKDAYLNIKATEPHDIISKEIKKFLPRGAESEVFLRLMERSREILENHPINNVRIDLKENPANMIWLWGQSIRPMLPDFRDKFGIKGSLISAVDLVNGIGKLAGLEIINVPNITGYYDTNYLGKAQYALKALKDSDFVFIHIEAPDEAGHNGDINEKIRAIENIDKHIVGTILNHFNKNDDFRILIAPDHATPIQMRTHSADPVGFVMYGKNIESDEVTEYNEKTSGESERFFNSGEELLKYFFKRNLG